MPDELESLDVKVEVEGADLVEPRSLFAAGDLPPPPMVPPPPGAGAPAVDAADRTPTPSSETAELKAREIFDRRYTYRQLLGAGGMGVVGLYRDNTIGREVALKVRRGDPGADDEWRFLREARVQGQLEHPAVLPVYDLGLDPEGNVYFSMKRVRGMSLRHVLEGLAAGNPDLARRFSRRRLLIRFNAVCLALQFAHERGVVHRDLKPDNILFGDHGEVYVIDWGLAKVQGAREVASEVERVEDASNADETVAGRMMGTPGYMAPEQIRGGPNGVDARADVYALGAMLFEILTLHRLHDHLEAPPRIVDTLKLDGARPSERWPDLDLPPELDALVHRATRLDPADRLPSAQAMSEAIEAFLDGERDRTLRKEAAARHAAAAAAALQSARMPGRDEAAERTRAMREVTRALGLDPEQPLARRTLLHLLTEPPREMPEGARRALEAARLTQFKTGTRNAIAGYLGFAAYLPFTVWMGIRDLGQLLFMGGAILAALLATFYYHRRPPRRLEVPLPHLFLTTVAVAAGSVVFGPLVLVPLVALSNSVAYLALLDGRRLWVVTAGVLAVAVPVALMALGVLPPAYAVEGGVIQILPQMTDFPEVPTLTFLVFANLAVLASAGLYVSDLRRRYSEAEARLHVQAWQLGRIVPDDDAQGATGPS